MKKTLRNILGCTILLFVTQLFILNTNAEGIFYFTFNKSSYNIGETIEASLANYDDAQGEVYAEIVWVETGSVVFRTHVNGNTLKLDAPVHPGTYVMRMWQGSEISSRRFTVTGSNNSAIRLTGDTLIDETGCIVGIYLEWEEDGTIQIIRTREDGAVDTFGPVEDGTFIDVNITANQIYSYVLVSETKTSNQLIISVGGSVPSESSKDKTFGYIELEIGSPNMTVNGTRTPIYRDNTSIMPKLVNDRIVLPIRSIVESMQGTVEWKSNTRTVTLLDWTKKRKVVIPIDSNTIYVNGQAKIFDVPAITEQGRTLVPIRHLEQLGCRVSWFKDTRKVVVRYECNAGT